MNSYSVVKFSIAAILLLHFSETYANQLPGKTFDLKKWKITLPMDSDRDGKQDEVRDTHLPRFTYPPYFFADKKGQMVFVSPAKVLTADNELMKPRSELRSMFRAGDTSIKTDAAENNFALKANKRSRYFGSVGARLEASLMVNHVAKSAVNPDKERAYTVVVGQINTGKQKNLFKGKVGYGYGNEPLKIYYKKWPQHETGSLFWTYERNLPADDPNRTDVVYPVWGETWDSKKFPDYRGIALGEEFRYVINIYQNTLELTFSADDREDITYIMNLADNVNAHGEVDEFDNPNGYANDWFFFRVGAYNQCSVSKTGEHWSSGCAGTGDWQTDYKNGDFSVVTFKKLKLGKAKKIKKLKN